MPTTPLPLPPIPSPVSARGLLYRVTRVSAPGGSLSDSWRAEWTGSAAALPEPWEWQSVRDHGTRAEAEREMADRIREDGVQIRMQDLRAAGVGRGLANEFLRSSALRVRAEEELAAEAAAAGEPVRAAA